MQLFQCDSMFPCIDRVYQSEIRKLNYSVVNGFEWMLLLFSSLSAVYWFTHRIIAAHLKIEWRFFCASKHVSVYLKCVFFALLLLTVCIRAYVCVCVVFCVCLFLVNFIPNGMKCSIIISNSRMHFNKSHSKITIRSPHCWCTPKYYMYKTLELLMRKWFNLRTNKHKTNRQRITYAHQSEI